jgi:dGTPase
VREGIIKHSRDYDPNLHPELAEYRLTQRPPLEAQLIDLADEIAYNSADLDDGYEAKLLTLEMVREGVPLFESFYRRVERRYPQAAEKLRFNEALKSVLDDLATDLIDSTRARLEKQGVRGLQDVRAAPSRLVGFSKAKAAQNRSLKAFLQHSLYEHPSVDRERKGIALLVDGLFDYFMKEPGRLPSAYFAKTHEEPTHHVICDYIAGMTDNYLREQWSQCVGLRA